MFGSSILEVAIGLSLMYLLFSLIVTSTMEIISQVLKMRSKTLRQGIENLLNEGGEGLAKKFFEHPLVYAFYKERVQDSGKASMSYIPSDIFAKTVVDLLCKEKAAEGAVKKNMESLKKALMDHQDLAFVRAISGLIDEKEQSLDKAMKNIASWYDHSMERVSGWYKQKAQKVILLVSVIIVGILDADSIKIAHSLMSNEALRSSIVLEAQAISTKYTKDSVGSAAGGDSSKIAHEILDQTDMMQIGFGLDEYKKDVESYNKQKALSQKKPDQDGGSRPAGSSSKISFNFILLKILGLAATVLSISLGAPFWFEVLAKIVNIRSTGQKPGSGNGKEAKSQDG